MNTKVIKYYIILSIVFFSWFGIVHANVLINEIEINPTEERFIELYNTSSSPVDLTKWYIQRKTATGSTFGSLVSKTYFEGISILPNGYLVISKNLMSSSDIIVDNLTLTESNEIQIKNSSQEVVDKISWESISEGRSIQRTSSGDFIVSSPTPGRENNNQKSNINEDTFNISSQEIVEDDSISSNQTPRKIIPKIITSKVVFAGSPFEISSLITTNKGETLAVGRFKWNFGDGGAMEDKGMNKFNHTYFYPGEYVITLNYKENTSFENSSVNDRVTIKVIPAEIIVSSIGTKDDSFIEIENKSSYEMDLSSWNITAGTHYFIIPLGTIILPHTKMKLSPWVTGFKFGDLYSITVRNKSNAITAEYPIQKVVIPKKIRVGTTKNTSTSNIGEPKKDETEIINLNDLGASAIDAPSSSSSTSGYSYLGLGVVIILGMASIIVFRRRNKNKDDIENEIRPEDITIIE